MKLRQMLPNVEDAPKTVYFVGQDYEVFNSELVDAAREYADNIIFVANVDELDGPLRLETGPVLVVASGPRNPLDIVVKFVGPKHNLYVDGECIGRHQVDSYLKKLDPNYESFIARRGTFFTTEWV